MKKHAAGHFAFVNLLFLLDGRSENSLKKYFFLFMPQSTNFTFRRGLRQSQRTSDSKQGSDTMNQGYNESVFFFFGKLFF